MKKILVLISLFVTFGNCFASTISATNNTTNNLNNFAFKLYHQMVNSDNNRNLVISPISVSSILTVLYFGTKGNTQQEIANNLGVSNATNYQNNFSSLTKSFAGTKFCTDRFYCPWVNSLQAKQHDQFTFGNVLWIQNGIEIQDKFKATSKAINLQLSSVDFQKHPGAALEEINSWVARLTDNYIKQLITPGMITDQTRLIATNAIYFKGLWQSAFDQSKTKLADFTLDNGQKIKVKMMTQTHDFSFAENNDLSMLVLPYKGTGLAMAILLPKSNDFTKFTESLNTTTILSLLSHQTTRDMVVSMPKFTIRSNFDSLENTLMALGIKQIFTTNADFSPLTTSEKIMLAKVIHKTYVSVDEKGTTAAAATGATMLATAMLPLQFNVNHPFIFLIYDPQTKLVVFIGQVVNPTLMG